MSVKSPEKAARRQLSHLPLLSVPADRAGPRPARGWGRGCRGGGAGRSCQAHCSGDTAPTAGDSGGHGGCFHGGTPRHQQERLSSFFKRKPSLLLPNKTPASLGKRRRTEEGQESDPGTCHPERAGRVAGRGAAAAHSPLRPSPPAARRRTGRGAQVPSLPPSRRAGPALPRARRAVTAAQPHPAPARAELPACPSRSAEGSGAAVPSLRPPSRPRGSPPRPPPGTWWWL